MMARPLACGHAVAPGDLVADGCSPTPRLPVQTPTARNSKGSLHWQADSYSRALDCDGAQVADGHERARPPWSDHPIDRTFASVPPQIWGIGIDPDREGATGSQREVSTDLSAPGLMLHLGNEVASGVAKWETQPF